MRKADNLPPYSADVKKSRSPSGPAWPVTGVLYLTLQQGSNCSMHTDGQTDMTKLFRNIENVGTYLTGGTLHPLDGVVCGNNYRLFSVWCGTDRGAIACHIG